MRDSSVRCYPLAAQDFLSASFPRRLNENDDDFRSRLLQAIGRTRATKPAIIAAAAAAGYKVSIFEAAQPGDTGALQYIRWTRLEYRRRMGVTQDAT